MNCTKLLKSPAQQTIFQKHWRKYMRQQIKALGGLEANAFTQFRKDYKRGFILGCKTKKIRS